MSQGIAVLLRHLTGDKLAVEAWDNGVGKIITDLRIEDNALRFTFADGSGMKLYDDGQSCCERRWMHTDDDLTYHIGAVLMDAELRSGGTKQLEYSEELESEFLVVTTSKGLFTVVNYNEHNGWYGGFWIRAATIEQEGADHE
jgi:hypothetical protein